MIVLWDTFFKNNFFLDKYEYRLTPTRGTYWAAREQCLDIGGDLFQEKFGPEGSTQFE